MGGGGARREKYSEEVREGYRKQDYEMEGKWGREGEVGRMGGTG